jgi:hypothetical protein
MFTSNALMSSFSSLKKLFSEKKKKVFRLKVFLQTNSVNKSVLSCKHSSLLRSENNYGCNKFHSTDLWSRDMPRPMLKKLPHCLDSLNIFKILIESHLGLSISQGLLFLLLVNFSDKLECLSQPSKTKLLLDALP